MGATVSGLWELLTVLAGYPQIARVLEEGGAFRLLFFTRILNAGGPNSLYEKHPSGVITLFVFTMKWTSNNRRAQDFSGLTQ